MTERVHQMTEAADNEMCFQNTAGCIWICLLNIYTTNSPSNQILLLLVTLTQV